VVTCGIIGVKTLNKHISAVAGLDTPLGLYNWSTWLKKWFINFQKKNSVHTYVCWTKLGELFFFEKNSNKNKFKIKKTKIYKISSEIWHD